MKKKTITKKVIEEMSCTKIKNIWDYRINFCRYTPSNLKYCIDKKCKNRWVYMMDECTKRADRIKELEEELADKNRDYKVLKEMRDELLEDWEAKRYAIVRLESDISQYEAERKLRIRREGELFNIINDLTTSAQA